MQFVKGANKWYKHWSTWGITALGVLPWLQNNMSQFVPVEYQAIATSALALATAVARFVKQKKLTNEVANGR